MTTLLNLGVITLFTIQKQAQAQENPFSGWPGWVWVAIALIIIAIGVIWTLWEDENKQKRVRPATIPEPVGGSTPPLPMVEKPAPGPAMPLEQAAPAVAEKPAPAPKADDLRKVSGIGPKIKQILNEKGIYTFEQLAATEVSFLEKLVEERGWHMANFATWPEQARALAEEKKRKV